MDRRDFLKVAVGAGMTLFLRPDKAVTKLLAETASAGETVARLPDMVAVRNGEPAAMFDAGIAAMGGMDRFVKKGQTVVLKPNASFESAPELGSNTNPALVQRVARHCLEAGASRITIMDHVFGNAQRTFSANGIGDAARQVGALIAPAEAVRYYQRMTAQGKSLKEVMVHEAVMEADVFINIPVLKHHGGTGMTGAIKNLMGVVWDRMYYHGHNLNQCIADFLSVRRPDLNIVDAYRVVTRNGPYGGSPADVTMGRMQILSTDIVAVDTASSGLLKGTPRRFAHIAMAHQMGFGEIDPGKLITRRIDM
jgi:uncharacterized protein (DUF362 family)